ncbi:unnamed protein product [Arctogadus glacialis]
MRSEVNQNTGHKCPFFFCVTICFRENIQKARCNVVFPMTSLNFKLPFKDSSFAVELHSVTFVLATERNQVGSLKEKGFWLSQSDAVLLPSHSGSIVNPWVCCLTSEKKSILNKTVYPFP